MIDQARFIREFGPHILHVQAKDLMIDRDGLYERGILSIGIGWQVPRMPGPRRGRLGRHLLRRCTAPATTGRSIIEHEDRRFEGTDDSGEARLPARPRRAAPVCQVTTQARLQDPRPIPGGKEIPCEGRSISPCCRCWPARADGVARRSSRPGQLHDRRLEHRAGQRLARGDDLRGQGRRRSPPARSPSSTSPTATPTPPASSRTSAT